MKKIFLKTLLGMRLRIVLGFKTIDALEKELEVLTKEFNEKENVL